MNHDDIEGLFREAAENYQVNADRAFDWEKIDKAVHKTKDNTESKKSEGKSKRQFLFLVLLLISISLFSYNIWTIEFEKKAFADADLNNKKEQNKRNSPEAGNANAKANTDASANYENILKQDKKEVIPQHNDKIFVETNKTENILANRNNTLIENANNSSTLQVNNNYNLNQFMKQSTSFGHEEKMNELPKQVELISKTTQSTNSGKTIFKPKQQTGFYAGALFSPDITFIKFQQPGGMGTTFGLTAGYQWNKHWAIESGISFNTKKYYSEGQYFDKSNVPFLNNVDLVSVSGSCNMIEIPVIVRYKFAENNKHNLTAALGTSSYIMTKEYYDYSIVSSGESQTREQTYNASSKNLFSAIDLSAGYERKFGKGFSLKAEPYFKIPVSGIGTGNLHMSSTGINIAITKYFGRK